MNTETNAEKIWKAVQAELQVNLSDLQYNTWIKNTRAQNLTENSIEIICSHKHNIDVLKKKFVSLIQTSVNKIGKGSYKLIFKVGKVNGESDEDQAAPGPLFTQTDQTQLPIDKPAPNPGINSFLNPKFTFETYLMGQNNRLAFSIAQAVSEKPGAVYNPFFLYSGVGLGKTHLLQAIGNRILQTKPELSVIYSTGETFMNELIEAIQSGRGRGKEAATSKFREKYRKVDVLLIDDIQFIAGKESTQEEFFHTFNTLLMSQKQIVIASDRPPKDFKNIEERITSRFGSGIIADIQKPDIETRTGILRNKRDRDSDPISNDIIDFIAANVDTNIRELEGAYLQVKTYAIATGEQLTLATARTALGQSIKVEKQRPVNLNEIIKAVCKYYSVKIGDVKGKRRTKDIVIPRQMAMYLIHQMTETPYMSIGDFLGGRDHTTIMHGVRKVEDEVEKKPKTKQDVANIKQIIYTQ